MRIAFLGTGRMGTELALHLLPDHELTVWNRTASRTQRLAEAGAAVASTAAEAVADAELVVTSLFGPDTVRETVIVPSLIPGGVTWVDTTTVSPADAEEFAAAVPTYVGAPVVGTPGPARNGSLGVYVGTPDDARREQVLDLVAPWADPERLRGVGSGREAAVGKL
ncbi:MAG TPA: NAD(P)-binding domain-containing protein, partial [Brachybacterium paraconglomeratum]|nr:NAD(P)-binding domain-containing protein [Brachybacterium paraconglomeratum]